MQAGGQTRMSGPDQRLPLVGSGDGILEERARGASWAGTG